MCMCMVNCVRIIKQSHSEIVASGHMAIIQRRINVHV